MQTPDDARHCAELFKQHADSIDGILVTLPNFGEERAIVDAIRLSGLKVPVLVQATPDRTDIMKIENRRDSFCGKMSACNNLMQYNIPYSLTKKHTVAPQSELFARDLAEFAATCRVVNGFRNLRIGALGARPAAFNTVRYSEKILERHGISVETLDLSEVIGRIHRMGDNDDAAQAKLAAIKSYVPTTDIPAEALMKMAKLGAVIDGWMQENLLHHLSDPVLDRHGGVFRRGALHRDEHDEREPVLIGVRDRRGRRAEHVRAGARERNPFGAARLEQQLRRGGQQGSLLPLLQPAEALLRVRRHGLPGHHCGHGRQGEYLWDLRGAASRRDR